MISLIRILALCAKFGAYPSCDVDDWGLDNVRDNGAQSVGISCYAGNPETDRDDLFLLVGPDWIADAVSLRSDG